jgi:outer membrane protein TolC
MKCAIRAVIWGIYETKKGCVSKHLFLRLVHRYRNLLLPEVKSMLIDRTGRYRQRVIPAAVALMLTGCATFSSDAGFGDVQKVAAERLGKELKWQRTQAEAESIGSAVRERLTQPLSADDAVQIALLNNPGLQASYAEIGIAEADLVQAGRIRNPSFEYLHTKHRDERKIEWELLFPIMELLTMPLRTKVAGQGFERAKLEVAVNAFEVAAETRRTYFQAVAAEETARYLADVKETAAASAELAGRMARIGNLPRLTQMREQVFYAETVAQLARARQMAVAERERLIRLMGLYGEDVRFRLAERLPDLPPEPAEHRDADAAAVAQRLDILAAQRDTERLAESLGLVRATRVINVLDLGPARTKEGQEPWKTGFAIAIEIPLFDWGSARVAKAEAIYMQSVQRVAEAAVNARSQVREAHSAYLTAYETARHYRDEIVPLRKKISDENLLRYNGMLISIFELLNDAREQVASVNAYIEALRDFWLAESDLRAALLSGAGARSSGTQPAAAIKAAPARGGH